MQKERPAKTWRELLSVIIDDPKEKQRLSEQLLLNPITLVRWANNETTPHQRNLRPLVNALDISRQASMVDLIQQEFPSFAGDGSVVIAIEETIEEIPSALAARIINAYTNTALGMRYWTISNLVLQQLSKQLEDTVSGLSILRCSPPVQGCIRSFHLASTWRNVPTSITTGVDTLPLYFFGLESIGSLVTLRPIIQDIDGSLFVPDTTVGTIHVALFPVQRAGELAGFFGVWRKQTFPRTLVNLLGVYADFLSLAFQESEFYPLSHIVLQTFPALLTQKAYQEKNRSFGKRQSDLRRQFVDVSQIEIERLFIQEVEEEILSLTAVL